MNQPNPYRHLPLSELFRILRNRLCYFEGVADALDNNHVRMTVDNTRRLLNQFEKEQQEAKEADGSEPH